MRKHYIVALAAIVPLFAAPQALAQPQALVFNRWLPDQHPINSRTLLPWFKEVEQATQGRVKIEYTAKGLVPPPKQIDIVQSGAADLALNVHGFTPGRFNVSRIAEMPLLSPEAQALSVALWRTHEKFLDTAGEYKGLKVLTLFAGRPGQLWSHSKPIRSADDLQGLKIFCGVRSSCLVAERLGATPVQRPGPEVREMIERRIVDAAFIDPSSYKDFQLQPHIRHTLEAPKGFYAPTFYVVMNEAKWKALAPHDQKAILALSGEKLSRAAGEHWDDEAKKALEEADRNKVQRVMARGDFLERLTKALVPPAEAEFYDLAKKAGVDGAAALAYLRAQIEKEAR